MTILLVSGCSQKEITPGQPETPNQEENVDSLPPEPAAPPAIAPPELPTVTTKFNEPVPNMKDAVIDSAADYVEIEFKNNVPNTITLPLTGTWAVFSETECQEVIITAKYKGEPVKPLITEIQSGDRFTVYWTCKNPGINPPAGGKWFKADLAFNYKNTATGMVRSNLGSIYSPYP